MNTEKSMIVRIIGTGPLSFVVRESEELTIKKYGPSSATRPSAGAPFRNTAHLVFRNQTKIGRISPKDSLKMGDKVPKSCTVIEVNQEKKIIKVQCNLRK